ncbi:MAG TPA: hypothetical protein VFS54_00680 [Solirubrobacterales bacterium]|nr:hypothetical protein [Solirubrobacterales bacterium]
MNTDHQNRTPEEISLERLRSKTGLAALIVTIIAVVALAGVSAVVLGDGENTNATVAIITAGFGIISTVATAFFGIRATANSAEKIVSAAGQEGRQQGEDPRNGGRR